MKERTPTPVLKHPRDLNGNRLDSLKPLHRNVTTSPGKGSRLLRLRPNAEPISLKKLARFLAGASPERRSADPTVQAFFNSLGASAEHCAFASRWLSNKRGNPSNPPLKIGSTRKKKNKDGKAGPK